MGDTLSLDQLNAQGAKPLTAPAPAQTQTTATASPDTVSFDQLQSMGAQPIGTPPSPAPASPPPVSLSPLGKAYVGGVKSAAAAGIDQAKAGFTKATTAKDPLSMVEGSAAMVAGGINTAASPLAPVLAPVGKAINWIGDKISNIPAVQKFATSKAGQVTSRAAEDVSNFDIIAGGVAGLEPTVGKVSPVVNDAVDAATSKVADKLILPEDDPKASAINYMNKALGNTGKKSATGLITNDAKRLQGLETLYTMTKDKPVTAPDGTQTNFDPTNIKDPKDLLQAFVQAKNDIWNQVQSRLEKGSSVTPDYSGVKADLQKVIDSPGSTGQAKSHAQTRLNEVEGLSKGGVGDAQQYLQQLNARLGATFSGASDAVPNKIDAQIAHGVNGALDKGLDTVNDASIRPLKDMYSSLKAIEPDIVKTTQKVLRQTGGGIPQYMNDFGNIDILDAALTHNPALFVARGAAKKVLAKVLSGERDPLANLSKAFKNVAKYNKGVAPTTAPTLALPPGTRGAPSQVYSGHPIVLPTQRETNLRTTFGSFPRNK